MVVLPDVGFDAARREGLDGFVETSKDAVVSFGVARRSSCFCSRLGEGMSSSSESSISSTSMYENIEEELVGVGLGTASLLSSLAGGAVTVLREVDLTGALALGFSFVFVAFGAFLALAVFSFVVGG